MSTLLQRSMVSGSRFESQLVSVIQKYTKYIWRNIRVETLLTQSGTTEIDILFCCKNFVFIVEAKNVSAIMGMYDDNMWSFIGASTPNGETRQYSALNIVTQNNIHLRSFKDLFYATYKEWPYVIPVIVVPNACAIDYDLKTAIIPLSEFDRQLALFVQDGGEDTIHRRVGSLFPDDKTTGLRPDFVYDSKLQCRVKKE